MKVCPLCSSCFEDDVDVCPSDESQLEASVRGSRIVDSKYRLERKLGAGGMGTVYRARHLVLQRSFALKLVELSPALDPTFVARFRLEAAALGRLKHPHIVDVSDFGIDPREDGLAYLVMEYLEGKTLAELCSRGRSLPLNSCVPVLEGVGLAIDYAHANGVIHRDLKPSNIFLVRSPDGQDVPKVLDFGLAQFFSPGGTVSSGSPTKLKNAHVDRLSFRPAREAFFALQEKEAAYIAGTPGYIAPEIIQRVRPTPSADIYALGLIAYEVLTGTLPDKSTAAPRPPSEANPALPPEIDAPILQMLAARSSERPERAGIGVSLLHDAVATASVRQWHERERPRRLRISVATGVALALASVILWRLEPVDRLERALIDTRVSIAPVRSPDSRLLLVSVDDASLRADSRALAERAEEFGTMLERIFGSGARAIAIDLLLPEPWGLSGPFVQTVIQHADAVTLAALSPPSGAVVGPECTRGIISQVLGEGRVSQLFGFVNVLPDSDGLTRRSVGAFRDANGGRRSVFAVRAVETLLGGAAVGPEAFGLGSFWIDFRVDSAAFPRVSWSELGDALNSQPALFRNRLVIVGAEFSGSGDDHVIPHHGDSPMQLSGLALQALIANTLLMRLPVRSSSTIPMLAAAAVVAVLEIFMILYRRDPVRPVVLLAVGFAAYAAVAFGVFYVKATFWPIVGPFSTLLASALLGVVLRRYFGDPPTGDQLISPK